MAKTKDIKNKAAKAAKNVGSAAANNWLPIAQLGILSIGGYLLYKTFSGIHNVAADISKPDQDAGSSQSTNPSSNTVPSGATITPNQAQIAASHLLNAMNRFGTDTQLIYNVLRGKTPVDYALIHQAFGEERYTGVAKGPWPNPYRNLNYWLQSELDQNEWNELKRLMPGVL